MRPKPHGHHNSQRAWQRRAWQYATYAFWPLLFLWLFSAYPSSSPQGNIQRHHPAVVNPGSLHGSSSSSSSVEQPVELSDTADTDWEPPKVQPTTQQQQQQVEPAGGGGGSQAQPGDDPNRVYSSASVFAVRNGAGNYTKFYYKFHNVRLTRRALYFYMPPGMKKPVENWVDFVSGNATHPGLPTMIVIKGEVQRQKWFYLPVRYTTTPSKCTAWTAKPTYLLQVRYSYNIWHTWNEGLMGAFQTLREQGLLPLAQVDEAGNMREVTEGLTEECPLVWDEVLNGTRPEATCRKRLGVVKETHCDIKNQPWCRPGVVSYHRFDGPIILPYGAASVMNRWAQVYDAMTTDVRDFSLVDGHCFKSLIVGKTNALNYYQPMNYTSWTTDHIRERVEAMAVFKAFVGTAQREFVAQERAKNPAAAQFQGYSNPKMERLRRGIGPEDIGLVEYIAPGDVPGLLREELPVLKKMWAKRKKENAKILAAWEAGKQGVVGVKGEEAEEAAEDRGGEDDDEEAGEEEQQQQQQGGGDGGDGPKGEAHAARQRQQQRQQQQGDDDDGGDDGEAHKRRVLRERTSGGGEGSRRRGHRQPGRSLLARRSVAQAEEEGDEGAEQQQAAPQAFPPIIPHTGGFRLETPRPVVTYMSRNFFSRGVLNEHDVLRYILSNYNVTLRVTTFEEPLLEAMELLQHTDVIIGMHGAGWTNGMFIKHGAVAVQMYPYGWRLPDNSTIRGYNYREIVLASECAYLEWVSQRWDYAFFRRIDFNRRVKMEYVLHPDPNGPHPVDGWPGNPWIYQNTYVDMAHFGPYIDQAMAKAGIRRMPDPRPSVKK